MIAGDPESSQPMLHLLSTPQRMHEWLVQVSPDLSWTPNIPSFPFPQKFNTFNTFTTFHNTHSSGSRLKHAELGTPVPVSRSRGIRERGTRGETLHHDARWSS
jgi:hypothetical protein